MYVTRPLSHYLKNPDSLSQPPPEGPNSGVLVIGEEEEESEKTTCIGVRKRKGCKIKDLPIPQNKNITVWYSHGGVRHTKLLDVKKDAKYDVLLIPVLNQPLSSNRYYAILANTGEAYTSSKEEDMGINCCFSSSIRDVAARPLDPNDIYQQFKISANKKPDYKWEGFNAESVASDGFPPYFLRQDWGIRTDKNPSQITYKLGEAPGLDASLRAQLPDFDFPLSRNSSETVVVGKWYCPFMFVKEGTLQNQIKRSPYYEMTLEQRWEQIFSCQNNHSEGNVVTMDVIVPKEVVLIGGREAAGYKSRNNGVIKFCSFDEFGNEVSVGLSLAIVERMKWEQERGGWTGGSEKQVRVKRTDEFGGIGEWTEFGCYVLVERFVLKRLDGSLLLTYDFKHTHQIKSKWE